MVCSNWPDDWLIDRLPLCVADHGREVGLRHHLVADLGDAVEFPHRPAVAILLHFEPQLVAGHHRPAEARVVNAHEIDQLAVEGRAQRVDHENGGGLRHRLDDEDAGEDRIGREVPLEYRLVHRDVLDADAALVDDRVLHAVDHQEWITVRNHLHHAFGVDVDPLLRWRFAHDRPHLDQMLTFGNLASSPFWTSAVISHSCAAITTSDLLMISVRPRFFAISPTTASRELEICCRPLLRAASSSLRLVLAFLRSASNSFCKADSWAWKSAGASELRDCSSFCRLARNPCSVLPISALIVLLLASSACSSDWPALDFFRIVCRSMIPTTRGAFCWACATAE